ncbi:MAG: repair protein RecO, repair protein RecO [Candidatus Levybacteria bacterium]|nr:repair protein RecO, repair protein RecO [Candidatus Levybacteria bacterium]
MRTYRVEGIVLKRRNLGEADRILTILSKDSGKIVIKAPGVRRIPSRRSSHVELLNFSQFTLYASSKSFLPIVTEAQTLEDFSGVKKDLHKIGVALYICELINGLCADNQENRGVFFHLKATLLELAETLDAINLIKKFEKDLLAELGFWSEAKLLQTCDSQIVMERLLERKLKTLRVLPLFSA